MPYCNKCGTEAGEDAAFCGNCGAPISSTAQNAPPSVPPQPQQASSSITPNVAATLSYVLGFITGIIFLVLDPYKNDRFVRFHAFQSILFSAALIVFWILWGGIVWTIFARVLFMWAILNMISMLVSLAAFVVWILLMYKAYNNDRFMIPFIGDIADRQAGQQ
jgi:uncharacterized membrane protein